jgi:hypothetical protein
MVYFHTKYCQFWYILEGLEIEKCDVLRRYLVFGIFYGHFVVFGGYFGTFFPLWFVVPRKYVEYKDVYIYVCPIYRNVTCVT